MENRSTLYCVRYNDDVRHCIASDGCTAEDLFKAANSDRPFITLMELGAEIPVSKYAAIEQSDKLACSIDFDLNADKARIYEINGGKGGIAEDDRTDDNISFTNVRISEYVSLINREETKKNSADKTYAYGAVYTVVMLDIGTEERKKAVSEALKSTINKFSEKNDMSQPYKNLLEQIKPASEFVHASQGHLSCLKYALRYAETDKELCLSMLDSIKSSENNPTAVVIIKGYECLPKDKWEDHGVTYSIGQLVDDP